MIINTEKISNSAKQLQKENSSNDLLKESLEFLIPNEKNRTRKYIFIFVEMCAALTMSVQLNTMELTQNVFGLFISVLCALVAIVFTGYAFFQALLNNELLIALASVNDSTIDGNKAGNLNTTNTYFAEVMILQIICILFDIVIVVFAMIMPQYWALLSYNQLNCFLSTLILTFLLYCNVEVIWEMKSFIFNTFQLFNLHAFARIQELKSSKKVK